MEKSCAMLNDGMEREKKNWRKRRSGEKDYLRLLKSNLLVNIGRGTVR